MTMTVDKKPIRYTETELALLEFLSDGIKHPVMEVLELIKKYRNDDLQTKLNMAKTIQVLRKKIPSNKQILCVNEGRRKFYLMAMRIGSF